MQFETPYNNPEIIYEVTQITEFITEFTKICVKTMINRPSLLTLMKLDKKKYTNEFIEKLIIESNVLKTLNQYLIKVNNGNFLVSSKLYENAVCNHIQYNYYKFLNILVDDNHLNLFFINNKFIWKPIKKKEDTNEY